MASSIQVSFGYSRQFATNMFWGVDYVHNEGKGWLGYDLNPGLRVNTTRTGAIIRDDLLGLASQLGIPPFANSVISRYELDGRTKYDGLSFQLERRFSGFWGARASYTLGHARGNNSGAPAAVNNYQLLAEKNLDLGEGPLDTDRRHNMTLNGRIEIPKLKGLSISALLRVMSGRPFSIFDSNVDADRNGILVDPLPAGSYSGTGDNSISVENDGGRNGAYGPNYAQMDAPRRLSHSTRRRAHRGRVRRGVQRAEPRQLHQSQRRPAAADVPRRSTALVAGGFPRQAQLGARFGF